MLEKTKSSIAVGLFTTLLVACGADNSNNSNSAVKEVPQLPGDAYVSQSFDILAAGVKYEPVLDSYLFTIETMTDVASVKPVKAGSVNGAPVLGYVFVTDLAPSDLGYYEVEGTVALAVTSHPDFDDTPLWDEDNNEKYDDDGVVYHAHWVVLNKNDKAKAGLAVIQETREGVLTPTSPMPMYLDSPGFTILEKGNKLHVIVPANAVKRRSDFTSTAMSAYLEVEALEGEGPLLKVERIYSSLSSPLRVEQREKMLTNNWPETEVVDSNESLDLVSASVDYIEEIDSLIFSMNTVGSAATKTVAPLANTENGVNGATVLGYVFPTTIPTKNVGFKNINGATLALAVTTHPDFDDTPLWDENENNNFNDDGIVYHTHWVALVEDENSAAGLSVPSATKDNLPPTAPMNMYIDSPNFHAYAQDKVLRIIVPVNRTGNMTQFNFDGVTATMNVDTTSGSPVLRVNEVHDVLSGNLSLPYTVTTKKLMDY